MISIQPNMQAQDELAALFSRSLNFNPEIQGSQQVPRHMEPVAASPSPQPDFYSASQHYHHSTYVTRPSDLSSGSEYQRYGSEPPLGDSAAYENVLRIHGINPATLTPSQLQLFRIAESSQQRRLLELWSICPATKGLEIPSLAWSSTTVEQEEQLAQIRFERQQQGQNMGLDGTFVQMANGQGQSQSTFDSEPYMTSGYEELMRREREKENYSRATDPVYLGPDHSRQQQHMDMASQYGAFSQSRDSGQMHNMDMM